jgi:hypothetical protein
LGVTSATSCGFEEPSIPLQAGFLVGVIGYRSAATLQGNCGVLSNAGNVSFILFE